MTGSACMRLALCLYHLYEEFILSRAIFKEISGFIEDVVPNYTFRKIWITRSGNVKIGVIMLTTIMNLRPEVSWWVITNPVVFDSLL